MLGDDVRTQLYFDDSLASCLLIVFQKIMCMLCTYRMASESLTAAVPLVDLSALALFAFVVVKLNRVMPQWERSCWP